MTLYTPTLYHEQKQPAKRPIFYQTINQTINLFTHHFTQIDCP